MFIAIVIIIIAWVIIKSIINARRDSQVKYLLRLSKECLNDGQTRNDVYNSLIEMRGEKKYSVYVIDEVIIWLLWALVKELINQGWSNPKIRETLLKSGYHEWYIDSSIIKARNK